MIADTSLAWFAWVGRVKTLLAAEDQIILESLVREIVQWRAIATAGVVPDSVKGLAHFAPIAEAMQIANGFKPYEPHTYVSGGQYLLVDGRGDLFLANWSTSITREVWDEEGDDYVEEEDGRGFVDEDGDPLFDVAEGPTSDELRGVFPINFDRSGPWMRSALAQLGLGRSPISSRY